MCTYPLIILEHPLLDHLQGRLKTQSIVLLAPPTREWTSGKRALHSALSEVLRLDLLDKATVLNGQVRMVLSEESEIIPHPCIPHYIGASNDARENRIAHLPLTH